MWEELKYFAAGQLARAVSLVQDSKEPSGTKSYCIQPRDVDSTARPESGELVLLVDSQAAIGTAHNL